MTTTSQDTWPGHRIAGGLALIAAPLFLLAGGLTHGADESAVIDQLAHVRAGLGKWYTAHLLLMIGFALLIPAAIHLIRPVRAKLPRVHLVAMTLIGLGGIAMICQIVLDGFGQWLLAQASDQTTAGLLVDRLQSAPQLVIPTARLSGPLAVGIFWCAFGLWRAKAAATWKVGVLGLASVALMAAIAAGVAPAMAMTFVALGVVMVPTGLQEISAAVRRVSPGPASAVPGTEAAVVSMPATGDLTSA